MARLVATDRGIGRLEHDDSISLLDVPGSSLEETFRAGTTPESLQYAVVRERLDRGELILGPPVRRPGKIWAVGFAYAEHSAEVGRQESDEEPFVFLKASSSIIGPGQAIRLPRLAPERVDYEGEVAVVIGRGGYWIGEDAAWDHVLGYTAANDVSARDIQREGPFNAGKSDPTKGKSFDSFTPIGPCVCTLDEYRDPADVGLRTVVDDDERQRTRTSSLVFTVPRIISFVSRFARLEPGDVILTGTPAGVGHPAGRFLRQGSVVQVEVEGAGVLANPVEAE